MRLLHPGHTALADSLAGGAPQPRGNRNPGRAFGESLSLYRICEHRDGGAALRRGSREPMTSRYFGERVLRLEDTRLLTGRALFVDDVQLPGMLHVAFLRSDEAHARITSIDVTAARARPGVIAVYTAADLGDYWRPGPLLVPPPPIPGLVFNAATQVPLARDKVRHCGEPLAMVVAESRYVAEDALDDITVDQEPLPAVVDLETALAPGAPLVYERFGTNVAARVRQTRGVYAVARASADLLVARRFRYDR